MWTPARASRHPSQPVEHEAARDGDVEARARSDHRDFDARVGGLDLVLRDAVPFVSEQYDGAPPRGLQPWQRDRAVSELDGDDPPAVGALLLDPALLARAHPVDARPAIAPERVAARERLAVVLGVGDGDAR